MKQLQHMGHAAQPAPRASLQAALLLALALCAPGARADGAPASPAPVAPQAAAAEPVANPENPEPVDVVEHLGERLPGELRFIDAFQNKVELRDTFRGKPVILTLVYFDCPMLCNQLINGLVRGLSESDLKLGQDYTALTVSFNPKDSPRESSAYQNGYLRPLRGAEQAHAQDWLFLTGAQDQIKRLADAVGYRYRWDAPSGQFEHPAVTMVLSPDGKITRYLYGLQFPVRDLRLAVVEAGEGRVGTSLDRALLKCFKYDPASRKYHLYVFGFVRAGAGLVFVALASMLFVLWRREWKKGKAV